MSSSLLHQSNELLIKAVAPDSIGKLQADTQSPVDNAATDGFGPSQIEIENVVDNPQLLYAMFQDELFDLIE